MSDHWRPDEDIMRARFGGAGGLRALEEVVPVEFAAPSRRAKREKLPEGAKPGLLLVTALSVGVGIAVYQVMGPRDVVAPGAEKHLVEVGRR